MARAPLALSLANLSLRPGFGSRHTPDRVFDRLLAKAGQADGDEEFAEDFRFLLRHWSRAENLTPLGWRSAKDHVNRHLATRARIRRLIAEHPEIEQEPIERPVFVVGLPRTATTLTHNVLSLSAGHRCPLLWELLTPDLELPPRHRRKAIAAARRMENGSNRLVPRFRDIHPMIAEGPEECTFALPHALMPLSQARIPEYQAWHLQRDFLPDYRYLKQIFQVLQYGRPRRRWILKSPMHLEHLDVLPTVFPDATLVWTHRDPVTAVASLCSLVETGMGISVSSVDLHAIGAIWLELLSRSMTRALEARSAISPDALVDVPYSWLGTDPHTGAPKLYEAIGAHWTDYEASRLAGVVARPAGTRPHTYDLSRYGLTRTDVETAFAHYNALRADVDGP
ncbi:sulfotransferase family protein [Streptomyces sp. 7N604]|uniref:sulfotransferase family protein n=1 Tax=Streptomyces sp. 7N604 TaxID=3457415 RepID=UPI003FD20F90